MKKIEFVDAKTTETKSSDLTIIGFFPSVHNLQNNPGQLSCLVRVFQLSCHRQDDFSLAQVLDASYEDDNQISSWTSQTLSLPLFLCHVLMRLASQPP